MALEQLEQRERGFAVVVLALAAICILLDTWSLLEPSAANPDDPRIRHSAWIVVFMWPIAAATIQLYRLNSARYAGSRRTVRVLYSVGLITMLLHVAVAFHLGHGWSHADAFDRTERTSGFGPGLFVNYAFVLLWLVQVLWMWVAFDCYLNLRTWPNRLILGFMWFVLFNASVVYGTGFVRWLGLVCLTVPWLVVAPARGASKG